MVLAVIGAAVMLLAAFYTGREKGASAAGEFLGESLFSVVLLALTFFGAKNGRRYGWWAIGILAANSLAKGIAILLFLGWATQADPTLEASNVIIRMLGGFLWGSVFGVYIFMPRVRAYFQISGPKLKHGIILGAVFVVLFFMKFASMLQETGAL